MTPPEIAGWNLALRFALEIGALVGLAAAAWSLTDGAMRWIAVITVPVVAAAIWGIFNGLDDPSRSGKAPVEVAGWIRLAIEVAILGGGAIALGIAAGRMYGLGLASLVVTHYATTPSRVKWLVGQ